MCAVCYGVLWGFFNACVCVGTLFMKRINMFFSFAYVKDLMVTGLRACMYVCLGIELYLGGIQAAHVFMYRNTHVLLLPVKDKQKSLVLYLRQRCVGA